MPEAVLKGEDDLLPGRSAVLARFAATVTARPWSVTRPDGLDAEAVEAATGVVAMFNYLTRVADASGIEFDYASPLPVFQPDRGREPAARPARESWPVAETRMLPNFPEFSEAWQYWRRYVHTGHIRARAQPRALADEPGRAAGPAGAGCPEPAMLHAISVVALQNAEPRLAMGASLTR